MKELALKALQKVIVMLKQLESETDEIMVIETLVPIINSKTQNTVLSSILEVLGKLSSLYPSLFEPNASIFEATTLNVLTNELKRPTKSIALISGCIEGLCDFYSGYPSKRAGIVIVYGLLLSMLESESQRYDAYKSCFRFLRIHATIFTTEIFRDMEQRIFPALSKYSKHFNIPLKTEACLCMDGILSMVGTHLQQQSHDGLLSINDIAVFNFLITKFITNINANQLTLSKIESEVKGLGHLARACSVMLPIGNLGLVYRKLVDQIWQEFSLDKGEEYRRLDFISSKIYQISGVLTSLMRLLDGLLISSEGNVSIYDRAVEVISRLACVLIEFYPRISFHKATIYKRLLSDLFVILKGHQTILDYVLKEIVYQAMIYSCSFPIPPDYNVVQDFSINVDEHLEEEITEDEEISLVHTFAALSLRDYLPFWSTIMTPTSAEDGVSGRIFDLFMECSLKLIGRLNLSYVTIESEDMSSSSDPTADKSACVPKDFVIYVNFCELFQFIIKEDHGSRLLKWAPTFMKYFVTKSLELPVVSGFYKLACSMIMALDYVNHFNVQSGLCGNGDQDSILANIKVLVTSTLTKLCNYNDELLLSCLTLIVNTPTQTWLDLADSQSQYRIVDQIKMAVHLGCYYLPLGNACVTMLSRWIRNIEAMKPSIDEVLPSFYALLVFTSNQEPVHDAEDTTHTGKIDHVLTARRDSKNMQRILRFIQEIDRRRLCEQIIEDSVDVSENKLVQLQIRLMRILGELSVEHCRNLVHTSCDESQSDIGWHKDAKPLVSYSVPFIDLKPQIHLERILPTIANIVISANDSQTKSIASEALHAIITIMIGQTASCPSPSDRKRLVPLLDRMFAMSLKLATDMNKVSKALFSNLLYQLAFWYSYPYNDSHLDTHRFIECLFEAILSATDVPANAIATNDSNSGNLQRDLAGRLLRYMLESSYSHYESAEVTDDSRKLHIIRDFLGRIYNLAHHFSPQKRLGAVFVLNSIYTVLSKDENLLKTEIFMLLYSIVNCQRLSESDKKIGIFDQLDHAFKNVSTSIRQYKSALLIHDDTRNKPPGWTELSMDFVLRWLLKSWHTDLKNFRKRLISVTELIAGCLGDSDPGSAMCARINTSYHLFEDSDLLELSPSTDNEITWCKSLTSSLECYSALIGCKINLRTDWFSLRGSSALFQGLANFLKYNRRMMPSKHLRRLSLSTLRFMRLLLSDCEDFTTIKSGATLEDIVGFLAAFLLEPLSFSLDMNDNRRMNKLLSEARDYLLLSNDAVSRILVYSIRDNLVNYSFHPHPLHITSSTGKCLNHTELEYLFKLLKELSFAQPTIEVLPISDLQMLFQGTIQITNHQNVSLDNVQASVLNYLLSLNNEVFISGLMEPLEKQENTWIYSKYKDTILRHFQRTPDQLTNRLTDSNWPTMLPIISDLLDFDIKCGQTKRSATIVPEMASKWPLIWGSTLQTTEINMSRLTLVIDVMKKLVALDNEICANKPLFTSFCFLLSLPNLPLNFKNGFIYLLQNFYRSCSTEDGQIVTLVGGAKELVINQLLFRTTGGSATDSEALYRNHIIETMMGCLQMDCSVQLHMRWIRSVIVPIVCMEPSYTITEVLRKNITQLCGKSGIDDQILCLTEMLEELLLQTDFNHLIRFLDNFYSVFIVQSNETSVTKFFFPKLQSLKDNLTLISTSGISDSQLQEMIVNLEILNAIYRGLGPLDKKQKIDFRESSIIGDLSRRCRAIVDCSTNSSQLMYRVRSSAFSCLCSVVIATQIEEKFFINILLKPNRPLFQQLILNGGFNSFPNLILTGGSRTIYRRVLSSRQMGITRRKYRDHGNHSRKSIHISSQFLSDSSLALDVNKLDNILFQNISLANQVPGVNNMDNSCNEVSLDLAADPVNDHPCMETMIFLFHHMKDLGFISTTTTKQARLVSDVPNWMKVLYDTFHEQDIYADIKYFIAKLLLNCCDIFKPYASLWFSGLICFVTAPGSSISQFSVSVICTVSQWLANSHYPDSLPRMEFTKLLTFIIEQCSPDNPAINGINLELYSMVLEGLGGKGDIPYKSIFANIQCTTYNTLSTTMLRMLAVTLSNKFPFMPLMSTNDKMAFIKPLLANLRHKSKDVYAPTFEICGMLIQHTDEAFNTELMNELTSALEFVHSRQLSDYVTCLALVTKGSVQFSKTQQNLLLFTLSKVDDDDLVKSLEIMGSAASCEEEWASLCKDLHEFRIYDFLDIRSPKFIEKVLQMVHQTVNSVSEWTDNCQMRTIIMDIFRKCLPCSSHNDSHVRSIFFQLVMDLCSKQSDITEEPSILSALLIGIVDPDKQIAQSVRNYCSCPPRLPTQSLFRATRILEILFPCSISPLIDSPLLSRNKFLAVATNLLLEVTSHSPDFIKPLFDKCLEANVTFETFNASEISSQTSRSMLPHFIAKSDQVIMSPSISNSALFKRPTSKNIPLVSRNFDWIKLASSQRLTTDVASVADTSPDYSSEWPSSQIPGVEMDASIQSQSSFLSPIKTEDVDVKEIKRSPDSKEQSLQKRFVKSFQSKTESTEQAMEFFRRQTIAKQRDDEKKFSIKRNLQQSSVLLYGNYRTGKVPDIQILNCSVVVALQMLAQLNEEFAAEIFSNIYDCLLTESSLVLSNADFQAGCSRMRTCLDNILSTSRLDDKHIVASCLHIAISHPSILKLQPDLIYKAATLTNNEVLAIVLLEKYLINDSSFDNSYSPAPQVEPPQKKQRRSNNGPFLSIAPFLMKLYKALDLNEEIIGLLSISDHQEGVVDEFRLALQWDCRGDFNRSFGLYNSIITNGQQADYEQTMFQTDIMSVSEEGLINCLKKLSRWSDLTSFLEQHPSYQASNVCIAAKTVVNSKLRTVLDGSENLPKTILELETLLNSDDTRSYEKDLLMPMEMATFNIIKGNLSKAEHYCKLAYKQILSNIGSKSLVKDFKMKQLQNMQLTYEMSEFINVTDVDTCLRLVENWKQRMPSKYKDALEFWEELFFYRRVYLDTLKLKFPNSTLPLDQYVLDQQLHYIDACITQRRTPPAMNSLAHCRVFCNQLGGEYMILWNILYGDAWLRSTEQHGETVPVSDAASLTKGLCNSIKSLRRLCSAQSGGRLNVTLGDCFWTLGNVVQRHWPTVSNGASKDTLMQMVSSEDNTFSKVDTIKYLSGQAFLYFEKVLGTSKDMNGDFCRKDMSTALMVLSDFCDAQLAIVEDNPRIDLSPSIHHCFIESTLLSMKDGDGSAINKFPRVLQVAAQIWDENCQKLVIRLCSSIPSWMFIPWLDQMMTYLFSDKSQLVNLTLMNVARDYPHAIFFPFNLRLKDDSFQSVTIDRIREKLSGLRLMYQFNKALHLMLEPEVNFLKWIDETKEKFHSEVDNTIRNGIVEKYQSVFNDIFGFSDPECPGSSTLPKGSLHLEFINEFRDKIVDHFQEDGDAIFSLTTNQFDNIYDNLKKRLIDWKAKDNESHNLRDYSPWLADYNLRSCCQYTDPSTKDWLEVPGQYNNITSRPIPERHVKIFAFDPRIKIMTSKQKPKTVKIMGDNEQCYKFLVKSGEDLRQDFRIEQLFNLINVMLAKDSQLIGQDRSARFIVTYNVIPVSKVLGMLQWVENTVELHTFLQKTATSEERNSMNSMKTEYQGRFPNNDCYKMSWLNNFEETNNIFDEYQNRMFDMDLLRRSLLTISKNYECFYRIRIRFIQQYAVMAAAHYILGIGDRHNRNFLIDESSGHIIGIDFGYSFGVSSIFLAVPELIPFRLTSSFRGLMRPAGVDGLFTETMDSTLCTLGNNQSTIMAILNVFVSDQIIDWIKLSKGIRENSDRFTRQRISMSRRKLMHKSPVRILLDEVEIRNGKNPWYERLRDYCEEKWPIGFYENTTNQLVAMATDTGFLARTFRGWEPWL